MATAARPRIGPHGRFFATKFVPVMLAIGVGAGVSLGLSLRGEPVASAFWSQVMTIVGLSALPLVVVAMRAPSYATERWRQVSTAAIVLAFLVVLAIVGVCMHELARVVPDGRAPEPPGVVGLFVTCIGTGVILAAVACGVVIAFFQESGSMEPLPGERPAVKANAAREQAD